LAEIFSLKEEQQQWQITCCTSFDSLITGMFSLKVDSGRRRKVVALNFFFFNESVA